MSKTELYISVLLILLATIIPRIIPFAIFPEGKKPPKVIQQLSTTLPYAVIGALVVFCLKDTSVTQYPYGIPEAIAFIVLAALHLWKKNTLLSMSVSTVVYMILVQFVFVA